MDGHSGAAVEGESDFVAEDVFHGFDAGDGVL